MTQVEEQINNDDNFKNWEKSQRRGRIFAGVMVLGAAVLFFFKEYGYSIPDWVFTWQMLIVAVGLTSGVKCGFKGIMWLMVMLIGGIFLAGEFFPMLTLAKFKIPLILFIIGLLIIFKPKNRHKHYAKYKYRHNCKDFRFDHKTEHEMNFGSYSDVNNSSDDFVLMHNVFAGSKKNIISKDFKGGDIRNTFGGCEINLMQADITNEAVININQNFGGIKLIVPAHWVVKSEVACVMGSVEDQRAVNPTATDTTKTLILKGSIFMAGVEIVSY